MGSIHLPIPVKLFTGILLSEGQSLQAVEDRLVEIAGPIDHRTAEIPFSSTEYYSREMGDSLRRAFFSFERLVEPDSLSPMKRTTNKIETEFRGNDSSPKRPVNIDPGYIEQAKVILASTKNFYHRLYLGRGVFGEVTMHFRNNTYQFFPWTYPDFKLRDYQQFFVRMRQIYRSQLKQMCIIRTPEGESTKGT